MSPILQLLMDELDSPVRTQESQAVRKEILSMQEVIRTKLSFEFLDRYSVLCNQSHALENEAYFEQGFFTCAQLFMEMLSRYSS